MININDNGSELWNDSEPANLEKFRRLFGDEWADEMLKKTSNQSPENIDHKLVYIEKILPKINQYIFSNATIKDFENILRKTPPQKGKRLIKKDSASYNLLDEFFMKFFNEMKIYIAPTTQLINYVEMSKNSIKKARENLENESEENKRKRKEIIVSIFKRLSKKGSLFYAAN